ncbi:MAG: hypothetical protein IJJ94_06995 [Bacteroidaceae bacterium]|jgi:hypothetical protein|nr:hypothetical protein [Bacteroidaceae bacterium]
MPENNHFKPTYTPEEAEECFSWFEQHIDELPASLQLSPSMNIPDLRTTVSTFVHKLRQRMGSNPTYSGQFAVLLMIREHIQKQLN